MQSVISEKKNNQRKKSPKKFKHKKNDEKKKQQTPFKFSSRTVNVNKYAKRCVYFHAYEVIICCQILADSCLVVSFCFVSLF